MRLALLIVLFVAFTSWSFAILGSEGLSGLVRVVRSEPWAAQMLVDVTIALLVAWTFLWRDARERGLPATAYFVATLLTGSIAVLAYLVHRDIAERRSRSV
jgi:hypothetical protein